MALENAINNLIEASAKQTARADALNDTVQNKISAIDAQVAAKKAEVDAYLANASVHIPLIRKSVNQYGHVDATNKILQGWSKNPRFKIEVSLLDTIVSNTDYDLRPQEHRNILDGMGVRDKYFAVNINIIRMIWDNWAPGLNSSYTIYPPLVPMQRFTTIASYARLIDGSISGTFLQGVTDRWGLCGTQGYASNVSYVYAHPFVNSEEGEVHFIWPAIAEGYVPLDRNNPKWGWMPSPWGTSASDTSI